MKICISFLLVLVSSPSWAQTGADELLNQLGEKPAHTAQKKQKTKKFEVNFNGGDDFQKQLASAVALETRLSFDTKQWVQTILDGEFVKAAHLWTAVQGQIPGSFQNEAQATQLYLLWKLGLQQTFMTQWIRALASSSYADSMPETVLETLVTPDLDGRLLKTPIWLTPKDATILDRLPATKPFVVTLKAWSDLRRENKVDDLLTRLPAENKLNRLVGQTAVYAHVRKGDLKGAARILKDSFEPTIEATHDLDLLAKHDVSIARILYQAGQMNGAASFYSRIPNQSPLYLPAREELSWVYLRQGDMSKLRGEIKALSSPVFKDRFQPETYLLRAVSDLKMCFYDEVDKDFKDFTQSNRMWAKRIDQAVNTKTVAPPEPDEYTKMSIATREGLEAEVKRLNDLGEQSIGAALPAVGWQRHWKDYMAQAKSSLEEAKKRENDESQRQWKNMRSALQEAIRKMQFVRVEYMSQVRQLSAGKDSTTAGQLVASNSDQLPASAVIKTNSDDGDQLNFPATAEVWPDELFKLRSAAQSECLKKVGVR